MLSIENLHVEVAGEKILSGLNLHIGEGETSVMFGQNGSGKTSLIMTIMGFPEYKITKGKIIFKGKNINKLSIDERARMGIGLMFQRPPTVRGVKLQQMVEIAHGIANNKASKGFRIGKMADKLNMKNFLDRDLNLGFSGGEMKRSELLQLSAQSPDLLLLDEPESGVDLENIVLIGEVINDILRRAHQQEKAALIITHTGDILDYVSADKGCVLANKKVQCVGDPRAILNKIHRVGYTGCIKCHRKTPEVIKDTG